nr:pentatricopeptide repeat protein AaPPR720 [Agave angustifolia]
MQLQHSSTCILNQYFDEMKNKHGVTPRLEHYASMVDLLAREGYLDEALDFIQDMPSDLEPDASLWGALLRACRTYRNLKIAELAARHLFKLETRNSTNYLLMMSYMHTRNAGKILRICGTP